MKLEKWNGFPSSQEFYFVFKIDNKVFFEVKSLSVKKLFIFMYNSMKV